MPATFLAEPRNSSDAPRPMLERMVSALGVLVMMLLAYALCPRERRRRASLRTVGWGLALLFGFAVVVLRTPVSRGFALANRAVEGLLAFSERGAEFVFGSLASDHGAAGFVFAFRVLPTILLFAALMAVL